MTERVSWNYTADYYESCNCVYGCACNFNGFPSEGHCRAVVGFEIREGRHGSTDLAGSRFVMAVSWPGAIHEGNGTAALFLDEGTTEDQRAALGRILTAQDGGLPHEILAPTLTNLIGPFVTKVDFTWNGTESSVSVGDKISSQLESFKNPVTGEPHEVHVVMPQGFIFQDASGANAKRITVNVDGLEFTEENTNGFYARVEHSNAT